MKPIVTIAPQVEPVDLEDVKAHLRVTHQSEDATILSLIKVARAQCEGEIGRSLITQTRRLYLDDFPSTILVPFGPLQSVTQIQFVDTNGATQTLASTEYQVDTFDDPQRIVPAFGKSWPSTRAMRNAAWVDYVAGYGAAGDAVPEPLRQWVRLMVGALWENREATSDREVRSVGFADGLLDPYRDLRM